MSEQRIFRPSATFSKYELQYENGERERIWIDNDTKDVYLMALYYWGGMLTCLDDADRAGEPILEDDELKTYLVRSGFLLAHETREGVIRALNKRIEYVLRAHADDSAHDPLGDEWQERAPKEGMPL